jgi:mRNA-degrading endonuclease RelE of RelBE toxin-antitoxin system
MPSKIDKFLSKLSKKEFEMVMDTVDCIMNSNTNGLAVKKLVGQDNLFRVKKGDIRIIYYRKGKFVKIVSVIRRSEKTYRDY